jgi:hypothetical protein
VSINVELCVNLMTESSSSRLSMREMDQLLRATARAETTHFWFQGFRRFVEPLLQRATNGISGVRLLDFGCGTGANLDLLDRFGRSYGFDLTYVGLKIVTSFDVLYGLPEPVERAAVAEMFRAVRPGGYVIVNVAALDCLKGDHSVLGREVRRYNRESLARLLSRAGFTIERMTYTNASLFLPMLAVRSYQRWRGLPQEADAESDITVPAAPINRVLSSVLSLEAWWVRRFNNPFGSSLLCLAKKPARSRT